jgi:hypothetical protein
MVTAATAAAAAAAATVSGAAAADGALTRIHRILVRLGLDDQQDG